MADLQLPKWLKIGVPVLTFLFGALLGPGFLWQWRHADVERQQHEVDTIMKTIDLRKLEIEQFATFVNLTGEYIQVKDKYSKNPTSAGYYKLSQLDTNLTIVVDNFKDTEVKVAHLENRPPRKIQMVLPNVPPPTDLKATAY